MTILVKTGNSVTFKNKKTTKKQNYFQKIIAIK